MAATIDKDLTNALKVARGGKPMQFAFLPKGSEGKLLVGKKIQPKQIAETKSATGASSVFKGRCVGEDGTLVFYVAKEPPATLLGQLKKRLKDDAGLVFPVEIRVNTDAEAEPAEGEGEPTADAAAAPSAPESPQADGAPAQPAGDTQAPAVSAAKVAVMKRLNALSPAIKEALKGPQAAQVQPLFVTVGGLIKKEDYQQADQVLDQLEPLLAQSAAVPVAPAQPAAPESAVQPATPAERAMPPQDPLEEEWIRRVTALEPRVQDARKKRAGEAKWMSLFMAAQDVGSEGDLAKALAMLDSLEGRLNAPPSVSKSSGPEATPATATASQSQPKDAGAANGISVMKLGKARHEWNDARIHAIGEIRRLQEILQEVYEGNQAVQSALSAAHQRLDSMIATMNEELGNQLDKVLNANADERPTQTSTAKTLLGRFLHFVESDEVLSVIDRNEYAPDMEVAKPLQAKLQQIAAALG
jgi:hypothetical protein